MVFCEPNRKKKERNLDKIRGWPSIFRFCSPHEQWKRWRHGGRECGKQKRKDPWEHWCSIHATPFWFGFSDLCYIWHCSSLPLSASALSWNLAYLWALLQWFLVHSASSSPSLTKYFHHVYYSSPQPFLILGNSYNDNEDIIMENVHFSLLTTTPPLIFFKYH